MSQSFLVVCVCVCVCVCVFPTLSLMMLLYYCDDLCRLKLNIWDVGGQRSLRSYWRNYYECTDGVVWVVDSADHRRLADCKAELHSLLKEEVR